MYCFRNWCKNCFDALAAVKLLGQNFYYLQLHPDVTDFQIFNSTVTGKILLTKNYLRKLFQKLNLHDIIAVIQKKNININM